MTMTESGVQWLYDNDRKRREAIITQWLH